MEKNKIKDEMSKAFSVPSLEEFGAAYEGISAGALKINQLFGQTRQRIVEIQTAIADTGPRVIRLGGNINDVTNTISEIATASRRNVIANNEDVSKMFAASKILGEFVSTISNSFLDVGIGISQIPVELEKSINYVQSIGGNTEAVMKNVRYNMEEMNRFQFEDGVLGLTKMAAQASMLRVDMAQTLRFADSVLDPEDAIKVASAFQRLGVAAGSLVDPFSLMNQSINDPSGLQTSLANVGKQFTFFDEKTKSFKINPQGVLTLRQMEKEAGLTSGTLTKMGLAAAEMDRRLSEISPSITFKDEEDKQFLQNITTMTDGKYVVTLEDGTKKELSQLNQEEFDKLIDQQKNAPKDLESIARTQLTIGQTIAADVAAIRVAAVGGFVTQPGLLKGLEGARKTAVGLSGAGSNVLGDTPAAREIFVKFGNDLKTLVSNVLSKDSTVKPTEALVQYFEKLGNQGLELNQKLKSAAEKILIEAKDGLKNDTNKVTMTADKIYDKILSGINVDSNRANQSITSLIDGRGSSPVEQTIKKSVLEKNSSVNVGVDGGFKIDVNFQGNLGSLTEPQKQEIIKILMEKLNTTDFKQYIASLGTSNNPFMGNTASTPIKI